MPEQEHHRGPAAIRCSTGTRVGRGLIVHYGSGADYKRTSSAILARNQRQAPRNELRPAKANRVTVAVRRVAPSGNDTSAGRRTQP